MIPKEIIRNKNEIRISATRKGTLFIEKLIKDLIPEINEGIVEIKHIARIDGAKTYLIVNSQESDFISPSRSIIGVGGNRIMEIKKYLPELIEVIDYSSDPQIFIKSLFKKNLINMSYNQHKKTISLLIKEINSKNFPE